MTGSENKITVCDPLHLFLRKINPHTPSRKMCMIIFKKGRRTEDLASPSLHCQANVPALHFPDNLLSDLFMAKLSQKTFLQGMKSTEETIPKYLQGLKSLEVGGRRPEETIPKYLQGLKSLEVGGRRPEETIPKY